MTHSKITEVHLINILYVIQVLVKNIPQHNKQFGNNEWKRKQDRIESIFDFSENSLESYCATWQTRSPQLVPSARARTFLLLVLFFSFVMDSMSREGRGKYSFVIGLSSQMLRRSRDRQSLWSASFFGRDEKSVTDHWNPVYRKSDDLTVHVILSTLCIC